MQAVLQLIAKSFEHEWATLDLDFAPLALTLVPQPAQVFTLKAPFDAYGGKEVNFEIHGKQHTLTLPHGVRPGDVCGLPASMQPPPPVALMATRHIFTALNTALHEKDGWDPDGAAALLTELFSHTFKTRVDVLLELARAHPRLVMPWLEQERHRSLSWLVQEVEQGYSASENAAKLLELIDGTTPQRPLVYKIYEQLKLLGAYFTNKQAWCRAAIDQGHCTTVDEATSWILDHQSVRASSPI